jgi:hypothetical protein
MAGKAADARAAYTDALTKLDAKSTYKQYVQVKLDALGPAPAAAPAPTAPTGTAPAPAPAPAAAPKK